MTRVLVTGASGLVGAAFTRLAHEHGWQPMSVGRTRPNLEMDLPHFDVDLSKPWSNTSLPPSAAVVVHLAQSHKFRDFPERSRELNAINTETTLRLAEYAVSVGAKTLVYASSGAVYAPSNAVVDEESALRKLDELDAYSASKVASEVLLSPYTDHLNVIILRPFFVYGPGQAADRLIPRLARHVAEGTTIVLNGPDGLRLNPIYVDDAAAALHHCITMERSMRVNIAGPEVSSLRDIVKRMEAIVGRQAQIRVEEGESMSLVGSTSLLSSLGYEVKTRIDEGLRASLERDASGLT